MNGRTRMCASMEELSLAYQAFRGDGDAMAKIAVLRPTLMMWLYEPFRQHGGVDQGYEVLAFGEFLEANRTRIDLIQDSGIAPFAVARETVDA